MLEPVIISERLELHHISVDGIIELLSSKSSMIPSYFSRWNHRTL